MNDRGYDDINAYISLTVKQDLALRQATASFVEMDKILVTHLNSHQDSSAKKNRFKFRWFGLKFF